MKRPLAVLIAEDSEQEATRVIRALLLGGFDVHALRVDTIGALRTALLDSRWDVVISAYAFASLSGPAAFAAFQEAGLEIPFIIVSGVIGEERAVELMRRGVHDILMKGNLTRLAAVVDRECTQASIRRDRAAAEAALVESTERYRLLATVAPVGIFHTDEHGSTIFVNPEWCRIAGRTPEESFGNRWLDAVHPDDRPRIIAGWRRATTMEGASAADYRFLHRDGSVVWVQGRALPHRNNDGRVTGYVGTITDITRRKLAEEDLRASEERYRLLTEHSGAGVGFYDVQGVLLFANARAAAALGMPASTLPGRSIVDLFPGPPGLLYLDRIRTAAAQDIPQEYEDHVSLPGGDGWFVATYSRVLHQDGSVLGVQIIAQDITIRKRAELEARALEHELTLIYDSMRDGFVITDLNGRILRCNDAYCTLLGYSRDELLTMNFRDFTPPASLEIDDAIITQQIMVRGYSDFFEKEYITRSGDLVPVELRGLLVRDPGGSPSRMWAFVRDITDRKRAERVLLESQKTTEAILNALMYHIAVVDGGGTILAVNDAWLRFALETGITDVTRIGPGVNYLDVCRAAVRQDTDDLARQALDGISGVIAGTHPRFYLEYPCHGPGVQRWFTMHVSPFRRNGVTGAVVAHENITERKLSETRIRELADAMRRLSSHLEDAREEERSHLAREIHDELGQALTALKMDVTELRGHGAALPERARERLMIMGTLIDQTARTVQRLAGELRPPLLDELGFLAAVTWYIQDFEERFSIACTRTRFDDPPSTERKRATALYRILQESLTNVARHAEANAVEIQLIYDGDAVTLQIEDNGKGLTEDESRKPGSLGILGMRERIEVYGGVLRINGRPGAGTTVYAMIPWPKE